MNFQLKKYAEWLSERGQIWPLSRSVTKLKIGPVTLVHNLSRLTPEHGALLDRIAKACAGQNIQIAFGDAAATAAQRESRPNQTELIVAPEVGQLATSQAAKKILWQEIQKHIGSPSTTIVSGAAE